MKRSIIFPAAVLLVPSLLAVCPICRGDWNVVVTGYVLDSVTGLPVTDAQLEGLTCWSCSVLPSGSYRISGVVSSPAIEVSVFAEDYAWQRAVIEITGNGTYTHDFLLVPVDGTPIVNAGPDITAETSSLPGSVLLAGSVEDPDRWPNGSAKPQWNKVSGPGTVVFDYPQSAATRAVFDAYGTYVLKLEYNDGEHAVFSTVTVVVRKPRVCPEVDAGPDITTEGPVSPWFAHLAGSASDPDNGPQPLIVEWSKLSGPGMVGFMNEHDPGTTARFTVAGTYVLELSGRDGECERTDTVTVAVGGGTAGSVCEPLAYWDFEEGEGRVAQDVSGHGHDGELLGSRRGGPAWVAGCVGGGLQFNGRDDYVDTGITDNLAQWTICCWVSSPAAPMAGPASGPMQREQNFQLNWNHPDAHLRSAAAGLKVGATWYSAGFGALEANTWYHLAATYDGTSLQAYNNGELITTTVCPGTPAAESNSLKLARHAAAAQFFAGTIDEAYVFPCALSQDGIKALMDGPVMAVREVIDNGIINDQQGCYASLNSGKGTMAEYKTDVLDRYDSGPRGHFSRDKPFGVVAKGVCPPATVDNLSLRAEGIVRIPAGQGGDWTFGVSSDDGFTLMLPGHDFSTVTNGELAPLAEGTAIRFPGIRARSDTLGVIHLPAGDYPFWLTYHECGFDAQVELSAAPGVQTVFDSDLFRLVGQRNIGEVGVPGLCEEVRMVATKSATAIESLADARMALERSGPLLRPVKYPFVNHVDPDTFHADWGWFAGELPFPNDGVRRDDDDFAVQVTGLLDIPADGLYQIGFDSDDGASLRITGESWQSIVADGTGRAVIVGDELVNDTISGGTFTVGQIALTAGCHAFEAVMFEHTAGCHFVLFGRGVSDWGIPDPTWHLLRAGGAQFPVDVRGLPLVPPVVGSGSN